MSPAARWTVAAALVVGGAGAWTWWRANERARADHAEVLALEVVADTSCDNLAADLGHVAAALEHPAPAGDPFDESVYSIGVDRGLVGAGHVTTQWASAFSTCVLPRALTDGEREAERHTFGEASRRALYQKGPELATTLRACEAEVKKIRALPFRRTP